MGIVCGIYLLSCKVRKEAIVMSDTDFYSESSADLIALETDPVRKEL